MVARALPISMLLKGCCSGTLSEWPLLMQELSASGYDFDKQMTCLEAKRILLDLDNSDGDDEE